MTQLRFFLALVLSIGRPTSKYVTPRDLVLMVCHLTNVQHNFVHPHSVSFQQIRDGRPPAFAV